MLVRFLRRGGLLCAACCWAGVGARAETGADARADARAVAGAEAGGVAAVTRMDAVSGEFEAPLLRVVPEVCVSRATQEMEFRFVIGSRLGAGAQLEVQLPYSMTGENADDMWEGAQTVDPDAGGYVWVEGPPGVELAPLADHGWLLGAEIAGGELARGDTLRVRYRGRVQSAAIGFRFRGRVRTTSGGIWQTFRAEQRVQVVGRPAVALRAVTPADLVVGEPFTLRLAALDDFGNPDRGFRGVVSAEIGGGVGAVTYAFTAADSGLARVEGLRATRPGPARVTLHAGELKTLSGQILVHAVAPPRRRFFGDTHFHTGRGVGYRGWIRPGAWVSGGDHRGNYTQEDLAYIYARDVMGLDWASASEHDVTEMPDGLREEDWLASQDLADSLYVPGRFTTFYAWEWTDWIDGHRLVYFKDRGGEVFHSTIYDTPQALFTALEGLPIPSLVLPHVMQPKADHLMWTIPPDEHQRIGEIYSHHNDDSGEEVPDLFEVTVDDVWSYRYAWSVGHRIGVIGSSDDHFGMPGRDGFCAAAEGSGGVAVALASANTREAIWEALEARRVYATTGPRILLDLRVDGQPMGSVIEGAGVEPPRIRLAVAGTAPLERVELVRGQGAVYRQLEVPLDGGDRAWLEVSDERVVGDALYYLRVIQSDGEMAWCSPIWRLVEER